MPPADLETRIRPLLVAHKADPGGYETNKALGIVLARVRKYQLHAEPYLRRALAHGVVDDDTKWMIDGLAHVSLLKGDLEQACQLFETARQIFPDVADFAFRLGDVLFRLGRFEESSATFAAAIERLYDAARGTAPTSDAPPEHLLGPSDVICRFFGEQAARLDLYLKVRALGWIDHATPVLLAPNRQVANPCLLDHWARYVRVVTDPTESERLRNRQPAGWIYTDYYPLPDGRVMHRDLAHRAAQVAWDASDHPPLLSLAADERRRGEAVLRRLGMPEGAWFAVLHVREAGFFDEDVPWNHNGHRNARIDTYRPAVDAIVERGGWVVRLGDPTMTPLPPMANVIDYAQTPERSDWMDIFLIASARFYVGMASGPSSTAVAFGVPTLGTNWFPLGPWPYCRGDLFIPKRLRRRSDGRPLTIAESLAPPLFGAMEPLLLERLDVEVIDNSAEEIAEATVEMLDSLAGHGAYSESDEARQAAFRIAADPHRVGLSSRIGRDFLHRHPELVPAW